jgi:hypothetical protein
VELVAVEVVLAVVEVLQEPAQSILVLVEVPADIQATTQVVPEVLV